MLVVGARLFGQASFSTLEFNTKSELVAKNELVSPVIAISLFESFALINGTSAFISGVLPVSYTHLRAHET